MVLLSLILSAYHLLSFINIPTFLIYFIIPSLFLCSSRCWYREIKRRIMGTNDIFLPLSLSLLVLVFCFFPFIPVPFIPSIIPLHSLRGDKEKARSEARETVIKSPFITFSLFLFPSIHHPINFPSITFFFFTFYAFLLFRSWVTHKLKWKKERKMITSFAVFFCIFNYTFSCPFILYTFLSAIIIYIYVFCLSQLLLMKLKGERTNYTFHSYPPSLSSFIAIYTVPSSYIYSYQLSLFTSSVPSSLSQP